MTTLDLDQHPELASLVAALRQGGPVDVVEHGRAVMRCIAPPEPVTLRDRLETLQRSFTSPAYPGNSVVDMRGESR